MKTNVCVPVSLCLYVCLHTSNILTASAQDQFLDHCSMIPFFPINRKINVSDSVYKVSLSNIFFPHGLVLKSKVFKKKKRKYRRFAILHWISTSKILKELNQVKSVTSLVYSSNKIRIQQFLFNSCIKTLAQWYITYYVVCTLWVLLKQ